MTQALIAAACAAYLVSLAAKWRTEVIRRRQIRRGMAMLYPSNPDYAKFLADTAIRARH